MSAVQPLILPSVNPGAGLAVLRAIGGAPWLVISNGERRPFASGRSGELEGWVSQCQSNKRNVSFALPTTSNLNWYLAARFPLSAKLSECTHRAQFIIRADDRTVLWRLAAPVPRDVAEGLSAQLAEPFGGKPAIGHAVPMPGTFWRGKAGPIMPVIAIPHGQPAPYVVEGGQLVTAASLSAPADDPFQDASMVTAEAIDWLWPRMIPTGAVTLLGGAPGMGKSQTAIAIAATVSTGRAWPCGAPGGMGSALVLETEDDPASVIKPRLMAAGADLRKIGIGGRLDLSASVAQLEAQRQRRPDLRLVVLSPIREFFGEGTEAKGNLALREALKPLLAWARAHKVAVLGVAHPPKGKEEKEAFAGSAAFLEVARAAYSVIPDPDDDNPITKQRRRILVAAKGNLSPDNVTLPYRIEGAAVDGIETSRVVWGA